MAVFVGIIIGSKSDSAIMQECAKTLERFGIAYELIVASAHRTPDRVASYIKKAEAAGAKVFIAAAGMAAHLAGAIAAQTTKPVIAVPIASGALNGIDALFSSVQMPPKIPVACVAINGGVNAAYLAAQILALSDLALAQKALDDRQSVKTQAEADSQAIEIRLSRS
ncbi:MAG: 5-(carboxyamino)imidazole ribonucleotide mutase [Helicobacteraceae bacterium]|jgi:5-(carboxyamino)imidazole ribonucleotide mutase|nr:5-(carboxyamino)imidazole ribonucleotide mutase [Helicobacteraceae bacterium]